MFFFTSFCFAYPLFIAKIYHFLFTVMKKAPIEEVIFFMHIFIFQVALKKFL